MGPSADKQPSEGLDDVDSLRSSLAVLEREVDALRRRLADAPLRMRQLEERLLETKGLLAQETAKNEKLSFTLREAREHIASLRDEVDKLSQPPSAYGSIVGKNDDGTVDVLTSGRKMRVNLHPEIEVETLDIGCEVVLNESFNVIRARGAEGGGEVVTIKEIINIEGIPVRVDEDGARTVTLARLLATDPPRHPCIIASTCEE